MQKESSTGCKLSRIATVLSFCSNDFRFLQACIDGVRLFAEQILVVICDHFFDGSQENYGLLEEVYRRFPEIAFIEYAYDPRVSYREFSPLYPTHAYWRVDWHNANRWIGALFANKEIDYLLFLDCDEIVEGQSFAQWLSHTRLDNTTCIRFATYWYYLEARFQALETDDLPLLVQRDLPLDILWNEEERLGVYLRMPEKKERGVKGVNGLPLFHHYSWVRPKKEFKKKCTTWRHYWERNWNALIDQAFETPIQRDFVRRYTYREVLPYFDPLVIEIPPVPNIPIEVHKRNLAHFPNVHAVERKEMWRRGLQAIL